jgi:hypothetical protein
MPEAMFLQIHGGDSSTMRMLELPPGPIRVGRGALCEVRLAETELAEVQCILRQRGNTWHYQPVGPSGRVWIDGRPAEDPRTVAQGVPFRVGDHWLTLRSAKNAFNDWVSFDDPVPVVPDPSNASETVLNSKSEPEAASNREERPRSAPTPDENEERLRRWQARLEQRERWLKDRQDERRWEARWKSAGESIRARSGSSTRPAATPGAKAPSPPVPPSRPTPKPTPTPRPLLTPPVSRIIEPRPTEPIRRVADPSVRAATPRPTIRPLPEPSAILRRPVDPPTVRVPIKPTIRVVPPSPPSPPSISRGMVTLPSTTVDWSDVRIAPVEVAIPLPVKRESSPSVSGPITTTGPISVTVPLSPPSVEREAPTSFFETVEIEDIEKILASESPAPVEQLSSFLEVPGPIADVAPEVLESIVTETIEPRTIETEAFPIEASSTEMATPTLVPSGLIEPSSWVDELPEEEEEEQELEASPPLVEVLPTPVEREPAGQDFTPSRWTEPPIIERPVESGLPKSDYPSARAIFAAQGRRPQPAPAPSSPSRRRPLGPTPTDILAPEQWTMSLWIGWLPSLAATLFLGTFGLSLAYEWMVDAGGSNVGLKLALRPDLPTSPLIDPTLIPRGGWWFSTASHMATWAVVLERANDGGDHSEDVRSLIAAAREASPLAARARFNVEAPEGAAGTVAPNDFSEIGRTRDVVSLMSTARRLREAGKVEASIRAYRSAMEIALTAGREGLEPPAFDETNQVRRYALPHEALFSLVVRNMAERGEWSFEQWTSALPPSAVASWVGSKVLARMQKKTEADGLADLAIRQADLTPPAGYDPVEHRAAVAEALAYRGRWTDASEQYRQAIDQVDNDAIRRAWWLNLSELAHRMSDTAAQARAIEAAQSPDTVDEITQRARKYQENLSPVYSPGPRR